MVISRQKETYRTPYESQPKDRLRQCVFGGSSNTLDFLPLDRAGNRRFLPIMIYPENAEVHILEDEDASRAYLLQVWAEAMTIYRSGHYSMKFSKSIQRPVSYTHLGVHRRSGFRQFHRLRIHTVTPIGGKWIRNTPAGIDVPNAGCRPGILTVIAPISGDFFFCRQFWPGRKCAATPPDQRNDRRNSRRGK